jgi:hypothetical protein
MIVVKDLIIRTPVELQVTARRVLEIANEVVNQVVDIQHSSTLFPGHTDIECEFLFLHSCVTYNLQVLIGDLGFLLFSLHDRLRE